MERIQKDLLRTDALSALRNLILRGEVAPGARLVETKLAGEMGISRNPIREAFRELEKEGLVSTIPRRGTFVATFTPEDVWEVYALREILEGFAIRLVVERMKPDDLAGLEIILGEMRAAAMGADSYQVLEWDMAFHREICRLSGNSRLLNLWNGLAAQIQFVLSRVRSTYFSLEYIVGTHVPLLEAIRARNAQDAELQLRHILEVGQSVAQEIRSRPG